MLRQFKLSHQTLCITAINFENRSLIGYVELILHPLKADAYCVKLNSKQCKIYRVCINDQWDAIFTYNDPTLEICQGDNKQRNLDYFQRCHMAAVHSTDPDHGCGEVLIKLPPEVLALVQEMKSIRVCVEFSLEKPEAGIHFVVPDMEGNLAEKAAHMFTYGAENSSRLWFPCVDSYSEPCTWKLEFTVDRLLTAVSCGDLVEIVSTPDRKSKTYHYFLSTPTSASNIALAVGPFEILVDPNMHEVTHFCLPHLRTILKNTTAFIHEAFEFFEELMSSRFPYSCYKQVFVDESFMECTPYATMSIFSTSLLHSSRIIDQTLISRCFMASAVAQQFFGNFITMNSWSDAWLSKGIAGYLTGLFIKRSFGNNEYRYFISREMKEVCDYEQQNGVVLDPSAIKDPSLLHFSARNPHLVSPEYGNIFCKKAHLVIRILEIRIGYELLLQVFNKLLALAFTASQQRFGSNSWSNMLLSTNSFLKIISTVTGKDIQPYIDQWVCQSGCARFLGNFVFNRKRNVVELEIKQDYNARGSMKYVGPLTVIIQELDGSFSHNFKIEENKIKFEITCHSKSRRNKKKKIPLMTGEEVDMDLSAMDAESPVLWLRVDPEMTLLRKVTWEQPDYMWQYQLKYERDVVAQCEAITALVNYPTPATRMALTDTLENEHCFCKVRMEACFCLSKVANSMVSNWAGPPAMMTIFRKMFGSYSSPSIIRQNNFTNFQQYFLLKTIPCAMAQLRNIHNICPGEVLKFLYDLFKYNDNSKNKYSDNYYRASLIDALAATVTPAVAPVGLHSTGFTLDNLSADGKLILEEITRFLNLEKLLPCYRHTVAVSCLQAIRILQKNGHLPSDPQIFENYAQYGIYRDVRLAALNALVDYIKADVNAEKLEWLLVLMQTDPDVYIRHRILEMLIKMPPFNRGDSSPLNTEALVDRFWKIMNTGLPHDSRLRCGLADLYYSLYGRTRPTSLPIPESVMLLNLKEKKTTLNPCVLPNDEKAVSMPGIPITATLASVIHPDSIEILDSPTTTTLTVPSNEISIAGTTTSTTTADTTPITALTTSIPEGIPSTTAAASVSAGPLSSASQAVIIKDSNTNVSKSDIPIMQPFQPLNVQVEQPKPVVTETQPQHTITSVAAAAAAAVSAAVAAEQAAATEKAAVVAAAVAGGGGVGGERVSHLSQVPTSEMEPKRGLKRAADSPLPLDVKPEFIALRGDMVPERMLSDDQNMFKVRMKSKAECDEVIMPSTQVPSTMTERPTLDLSLHSHDVCNLSEESNSPPSSAHTLPEMSSTSNSAPSSFGGLKLQSQSSLDFSRPDSSEESSSKSHKSKKKKKKNKHKHKHKHKQDRPDKPEFFFHDKEKSEHHHYSSAGSNSPGTQPPSSPEFQVI